jgi:flavin reductase (DIM6/NTAB) family NADH-FMN oxidoreductase RutF
LQPRMIDAFRLIPYGIYVLAIRREEEALAMIVSWVSQVSFSPPLLMVALRENRKALPAIREKAHFSLGLLRKGQETWISRVKEKPPEPLSSFFLQECLASWECCPICALETGDHTLCIGQVLSASTGQQGEPLTTLNYGKPYVGQF